MVPPLTGRSLIPHPQTEGWGSMKRILCSLLVATLPFGSVLADAPKSKNAKVTVVYQHELPNVPTDANERSCLVSRVAMVLTASLRGRVGSQWHGRAGTQPENRRL